MPTITVSIRFRADTELLVEAFENGLREGAQVAGVEGTIRTQVVGDAFGVKTTVETTERIPAQEVTYDLDA